jgi:hypothetical protein
MENGKWVDVDRRDRAEKKVSAVLRKKNIGESGKKEG